MKVQGGELCRKGNSGEATLVTDDPQDGALATREPTCRCARAERSRIVTNGQSFSPSLYGRCTVTTRPNREATDEAVLGPQMY